MASSIEEDVNQTALSYLLDGRSKRAVHVICLRLAPFCKAHETLWDGVKRLETMLRISTDANCQHLVVVTTLVLVCFMVDNSTNMRIDTSADLNKCWLGILPDVVGPHARTNARWMHRIGRMLRSSPFACCTRTFHAGMERS